MDNQTLFFYIYNLSGKNQILDQLMVFGAVYVIYLSYTLGLLLALIKRDKEKKAFILSIVGLIISYTLIFVIHLFIQEPRPFITFPITPLIDPPNIPSFPSIHATLMAVISFAFLFQKSKFTPLFVALLLWVSLARIFVGVHYPLDILGGILTGFISALLASQGDGARG